MNIRICFILVCTLVFCRYTQSQENQFSLDNVKRWSIVDRNNHSYIEVVKKSDYHEIRVDGGEYTSTQSFYITTDSLILFKSQFRIHWTDFGYVGVCTNNNDTLSIFRDVYGTQIKSGSVEHESYFVRQIYYMQQDGVWSWGRVKEFLCNDLNLDKIEEEIVYPKQ